LTIAVTDCRRAAARPIPFAYTKFVLESSVLSGFPALLN